ncbi:cell division ATP-binding protein FtsE [Paracoccaceae bacterium GXU_MW_L88]
MITFRGAGFSYGGGEIFSALSLDITPGGFYFLTGPSGAGKTTFLRLCYRALTPTKGTVSLYGQNASEMSRDDVAHLRRKVGVVTQDTEFLDHLSIAENIALPLTVAGKDPAAHLKDLTDLINWVGLKGRADALPQELSGGELQRAALARAVIAGPELILADEPTGNIDWEMGMKVLGLLIELNRMGKTILIATHDLNLVRAAQKAVDVQIMRLDGGNVKLAGSV